MSKRFQSVAEMPAGMQARVIADQTRPAKYPLGPMLLKPRKYHNKPTYIDGMWFDSALEGRCYELQKLRKLAGELLWFTRQVPFRLEGGIVYRADFLTVLAAGGVEVIDAKGRDTRGSINKRKQVKARYGFEVKLWSDKRSTRK